VLARARSALNWSFDRQQQSNLIEAFLGFGVIASRGGASTASEWRGTPHWPDLTRAHPP